MPSDSIAGFLDQAQANRVLFPEQVEQLIRQPDVPQSDLSALCDYLEARGVLTRFQSELIRTGRGHDLAFAGYPILDEIGPCPGGTAYHALHPSLRTPVLLRRLRADALAPADTTGAFVARARAAAAVHHPNLVTLLDAGFHQDEPYAAIEPPADAADLESLVREIGPMPVFLAVGYAGQVAAALRAAHERGSWHGDVRPANMLIAPMTNKTTPAGKVKRRPAPNAAVRLAELGLVPLRPPVAATPPAMPVLPYVPPERLGASNYDPRGDLYGLGASLYFLLTGRPPLTAGSEDELVQKVASAEPAPLVSLRPDVPAELVELVAKLMAKKPGDRPPTAFDAEQALAKFGRPAAPVAVPGSAAAVEELPAADLDAQPVEAAEAVDEWSQSLAFSTTHTEAAPPQRKPRTAKEKARTRMLLILGLALHLTATTICLVAVLPQVFKPSDSNPEQKAKEDEPKKNQGPILSPREKQNQEKQKQK
jgi:serine/threonine protein kinase